MGGTGVGARRGVERRRRSPSATSSSGRPAGRTTPCCAAKDARVVDADVDPALHLSLFGINGLTAYFGLFDVGAPQAGETVVVSAASGSVGHLVGQMARIHGCRVVGVTGSDAKGELLTGQLGFDAAVNHRSDTFRDDFKAATPDGIDIYFDNTGGDILGAALRRMRPHGRIVCCGVVSQYDTSDPQPGPRGIPGLLVNNRVRMEGFLVFDFADRYDDGRAQMRTWLDAGDLVSLHDEVTGLDQAPQRVRRPAGRRQRRHPHRARRAPDHDRAPDAGLDAHSTASDAPVTPMSLPTLLSCASWPVSSAAGGSSRRIPTPPARPPTRCARRCSTPSPASTSSSAPGSPTSTPAAARSASRRCRAAPSTARSSSATAARSGDRRERRHARARAAAAGSSSATASPSPRELDADLVFADPPYGFDDWPRLLRAVRAAARRRGRRRGRRARRRQGWEHGRVKRYGRTWVTFLTAATSP